MKYKIIQELDIFLEPRLNDEFKKGYSFKCNLFSWNTTYKGGTMKLITLLLEYN